ncbi:hypothetical protein BJ944DRAFT_268745 [Cunninghamella echinulata]|nr:hypothetical protein BJ944DRAFT_268745 [Cunninghamella echinulata]
MSRGPPPPPPIRSEPSRRQNSSPSSPLIHNNRQDLTHNNSLNNRLSSINVINVQPSYQTLDIEIPEPPQTEAGKWTFHSQREFPPPPPFEKKLKRYPTGAETGCSLPIDLSHLGA